MSLDDQAMRKLEGETYVQAELLRQRPRLTESEFKALVTGMLGGICDVLAAAFGREEESGFVVLPDIGDGALKLVWSQNHATGERA